MSAAQSSKRVGDIFQVLGGGTPTTKNPTFWNGSIPWATSADLDNDLAVTPRKSISKEAITASATNLVPAGSVIVATRVGLGKVGIAETKLCFSQDCQGLIVDPKICDSKFVAHQLKLRVQIFKHISRGTTIAGVTKKQLLDVPFDLPPLSEQRRIVGEIEKQFSRLEEGVGALKRVQANLRRYRAAVLKAACEGKLVPTEAEIAKTKKQKFETGEKLLARILAERHQNWQGRGKYKEPVAPDTSKLGILPEGWAWATPDQLADIDEGAICAGPFGTIFKARDFRPSGIPIIFLRHVAPGRYLTHKPGFMDKAKWDDLFRPYSVFGGELLITKLGEPPGVCAIYPSGIGPAMVTPDVIKMSPNTSAILPIFLMHYFNSQIARDFATGIAFGTTRLRLTIPIFREMPVPLPPFAEQSRIVAEVERRLSVVEELEATVEANLQRATRLRQSILQKAFEGKLVANGEAAPAAVGQSAKTVKSPRLQRHFARAILSAEIVHRLYQEPTFGRTKHQKIFHLCEYIAQIGEIQGQYHRDAAGPLDNKLIYANEDELKRQKWFETISRDGGKGHAYKPLEKAGEHRQYVERFWPDKLPGVGILIELMRAWKTEQCEIFCTTYAAWNDLILWGKEPTDDAILHEILECWHESKRRIPEERWKKAIEWMKKSGFAPSGFGQPTKKID